MPRVPFVATLLVLVYGCGAADAPEAPSESPAKSEAADDAALYRNNLKQLSLAVGNHVATYRDLPGVDRSFINPDSSPGLSWRVHLLPYLGADPLWEQFHRDEPWDSEHNLTLLDKMPELFRSPGVPNGKTSVHLFVGEGTAFGADWSQKRSLNDIADGPARTLSFVLAGPETAEEWTKPGGIDFNPTEGIEQLGTAPTDYGFPVAVFDQFANPAFLPAEIDAQALGALVLASDGKGSQLALNHLNPAELATEVASTIIWNVGGKPAAGDALELIANASHEVTCTLTLERSLLPGDEHPDHLRETAMKHARATLRIPDTNGMTTHQLSGTISADGLTLSLSGNVRGISEEGARDGSLTIADYANPIVRENVGFSHPLIVAGRFPISVRSADESSSAGGGE